MHRVVNELEIAGPSSYTSRSNDALITTKVKASLVDMQTISANSFKVVTERGTVYLMGRVTQREGQIGADVARGVSGVQKVVKVFEYINEDDLRAPAASSSDRFRRRKLPAMASTSCPSRWIKPAAIGALVLALAGVGYAAFMQRARRRPDVTFISLKGEKISTQSLRGKVVMVNFWATSCVTCVKEMPQMVETYNKFKGQGLEFVAVAMQYDPPNYVHQLHRNAQAAVHGRARLRRRHRQVVRRRHPDADHLRDRQGRQDHQALRGRTRSSPSCTRCCEKELAG